jgi:hypothetical protein
MKWLLRGKWTPVLEMPEPCSAKQLAGRLQERLHRSVDSTAEKQVKEEQRQHSAVKKKLQEAQNALKKRRLRGAERDAAYEKEVEPIRQQEDTARTKWLHALAAGAPAAFLGLGKALSVTREEYRRFATAVYERQFSAENATIGGSYNVRREDVDFAAAFGCDGCLLPGKDRVAPTEFQLITGSGQQFFLETLQILMEEITAEKVERALFGPWTYGDLKRSFRWDPREDRRYAYGWANPSDDEVHTDHRERSLADTSTGPRVSWPARGRRSVPNEED